MPKNIKAAGKGKGKRVKPSVVVKPKKTDKKEGARAIRLKPGTGALREIKRYQKTTHCLLPRAPFMRVVKDIAKECGGSDLRFQSQAIQAL